MTATRFSRGGPTSPKHVATSDGGISLRDFFAAAALTGLVTRDKSYELPFDHAYEDCVAFTAYALADAMLAERQHGGDQ